ncbi:BrnT family toxin [Jiella endophytica]|uniref:BrnT family toxin n=1 Tax=Jiella endophytica TaxID=2558362 RepID=A0A4Y8RQU0_9HYPH|nr:BrnT family toxin [Jiella endophytica]TFF25661.1 BrnT family toxin [Jiella endophytica]
MGHDVRFEWDEAKSNANLALGRPPFSDVERFDFATAAIFVDNRRNYGETRKIAIGMIGDRHHVIVYTERGARVRVISFRKANDREVGIYARHANSLRKDRGQRGGLGRSSPQDPEGSGGDDP